MFIICLCFLFTGLVIKIFRDYKINYVYIFDIEQQNRMNQYSFYQMYLWWQGLLLVAFTLEILGEKGYITDHFNWPTASYVSLMLFIMACPLDIFNRAFRYEMMVATYYTILAPFCPVRFKDFFLGDVLTSMTKPLVDACFMMCFLV